MIVLNYFKGCVKKNSKYLPSTLLFALVMGVLLALIFSVMFSFGETETDNTENKAKLGVGIVGDMTDKYIAPGIEMVKNLDVSEDYLDIITFDDENQAIAALEKGKIVGYLYIPEDFLSSIRHGENEPAKYVSKNSPVDLGPVIVSDVLGTISNLVVESQSGIFAMETFYKENGIKGRGKALNLINLRYLNYVFSRDDFTKVTELGTTGDTTLGGYYICGLCILIVLLVGVLSANCVIKRDLSLPRLLSTKGCSAFFQTFCEILSFTMLSVCSLLLVIIALGIYNVNFGIPVDELTYLGVADFVVLFIKFLPAVLALSFMQYFLYELCSNVVSATLLQFIISISLAYISGCFYPKHFFPVALRDISSVLPVGFCFDYLREVLVDNDFTLKALGCLGFSLLFLILSSVVRNIKIRSRMV